MTVNARSSVVAGLLAATLVLVLSACAPDEPAPTPSDTASLEPTAVEPTVSAAPSVTPSTDASEEPSNARPASRFNTTCAELAALMTSVGDVAGSDTDIDLMYSPDWMPGPAEHIYAQVGGLHCALTAAGVTGTLKAMPDDGGLIQADYVAFGAGSYDSCVDGVCNVILTGEGYMFELHLEGAIDPTMFEPAATEAFARLAAALTAGPEPRRLTATCEQVLPLDSVPGAETMAVPEGGWSLEHAALVSLGARPCLYGRGEGMEMDIRGTLTALPSGAWARGDDYQATIHLDVDGAEATVTCRPTCNIDVVVNDDWVRLALWYTDPTYEGTEPIAQAIADGLR